MDDRVQIDKMYRIQAGDNHNPFEIKSAPVKRVTVASDGEITFNPDSNKFIYFSKNNKHHTYFIFNKFFKIIKDEIKKANTNPQFAKLKLDDDFRAFTFHSNVNIDAIKHVREFFKNYIPPQYLELVTLKYLNSFSTLIDECSIRNVKKTNITSLSPETSDTGTFGGAYGINSAWLEFLKCSTISTQTANLYVDKFFEFLLDTSSKAKVSKQRLSSVISSNPYLMDNLNEVTYKELANPQFFDQNNTNDVVKYLQAIEEGRLFNESKKVDYGQIFTPNLHKTIKDEIREVQSNPELYLER